MNNQLPSYNNQTINNNQCSNNQKKGLVIRILGSGIYLVIVFLVIGYLPAYALNLDQIKSYYVSGDYKSAIREGEKLLAKTNDTSEIDELYYFLGLSYIKEGNYLKASDIFEIIIKELKASRFKEQASLGLADSYFLNGDYTNAQKQYQQLNVCTNATVRALLPGRLNLCAAKLGVLEGINNKQELYYSLQAGSFSNKANAEKLINEFNHQGISAFMEEAQAQGLNVYRVKAGKFKTRQEAQALKEKLNSQGYPARICP